MTALVDAISPTRLGQPFRALLGALEELESRFPSHRPLLTVELRNKKLKRRPK